MASSCEFSITQGAYLTILAFIASIPEFSTPDFIASILEFTASTLEFLRFCLATSFGCTAVGAKLG